MFVLVVFIFIIDAVLFYSVCKMWRIIKSVKSICPNERLIMVHLVNFTIDSLTIFAELGLFIVLYRLKNGKNGKTDE